jgi:hypothetical protein
MNQLPQDISAWRLSPEFDCELPEGVIAELRRPVLLPPPAKNPSWGNSARSRANPVRRSRISFKMKS